MVNKEWEIGDRGYQQNLPILLTLILTLILSRVIVSVVHWNKKFFKFVLEFFNILRKNVVLNTYAMCLSRTQRLSEIRFASWCAGKYHFVHFLEN